MTQAFLPIDQKDLQERGWSQVDFVYICGDAYVDHPSFGMAIISRVLEDAGYKVGIISQPNWRDEESIAVFGRPRLGFLVSAGNMDSLVNHYTVAKRHRERDAYSPGGQMGLRPDRASIVYCNLIRRRFRDVPVIVGGVEASLRRLAHYDYWSDTVRRSLLLDAQADLLAYGMGERAIVEIADGLNTGLPVSALTWIRGVAYRATERPMLPDSLELPPFSRIREDRRAYAESFRSQYRNADPISGKTLIEPYGEKEYVVVNPPALPLSSRELDHIYELPYTRQAHPCYTAAGGVPALSEVKFSLTSSRGCFGGCSFCSLSFHQGRIVQSRSHASLLAEAQTLIGDPEFKGYLHDVGGPTANFRHPACASQLQRGACPNRQCLFPTPCSHLDVDHGDYIRLLRELRQLPRVKKVFVRSGVRFDYALLDKSGEFLRELCAHHISGQLKLAPEHCSDTVLQAMGKPPRAIYERFVQRYQQINKQLGMEQYVEPYLISSHPGSGLKEAIELAEWLRDQNISPEQVQDFYPTPSTLSTCMYYTGLDPRDMSPIFTARNPHEKAMQRALIQYRDPKNRALVLEALRLAGRTDLIGFDHQCLVPPRETAYEKEAEGRRAEGESSRRRETEARNHNGHGKKSAAAPPSKERDSREPALPKEKVDKTGWAKAKPKAAWSRPATGSGKKPRTNGTAKSSKPTGKTSGKPGMKPGSKPGAMPGGKPDARPGGKPGARPGGKPGARPGGKQGTKPGGKPGGPKRTPNQRKAGGKA